MQADVLVAAFADSPAVRETLAVLLERECRLRFLAADTLPSTGSAPADLAVVAAERPENLVRRLATDWPTVPIVAIDLNGRGRQETSNVSGNNLARIKTVPLQPEAIRAAVLPHLQPGADRELRVELCRLVSSLRTEVADAVASLRTIAGHHAPAGPAGEPLADRWLASAEILLKATAQMEAFRGRPHTEEVSRHFVAELGRTLAAAGSDVGALRFQTVVQSRVPGPPGPVAMVPIVGGFLRAHVHSRSVSPIITVFELNAGLSLRYPARDHRPDPSWPLLLAALALRPYGWNVNRTQEDSFELLDLRTQAGTG